MDNPLKKLFNKEKIYDEDIPNKFKESFFKHMFGCTVGLEYSDTENLKNPMVYYYTSDFKRWYYKNQTKIERHYKFKKIFDKL
jgi:hypothetical protein